MSEGDYSASVTIIAVIFTALFLIGYCTGSVSHIHQ